MESGPAPQAASSSAATVQIAESPSALNWTMCRNVAPPSAPRLRSPSAVKSDACPGGAAIPSGVSRAVP